MTEQEFNQRIMPLYNDLYGYALHILRNETESSDCLQDAFCKLWEHRDRLASIDNIRAYCIVTVKRTALDFIRKKPAAVFTDELPEDLSDSGNFADAAVNTGETIQAVNEIFQQIPERHRKIMQLSALQGMSNSEIEKATGLSGDNVRVMLSRGRSKFKLLFEKWRRD